MTMVERRGEEALTETGETIAAAAVASSLRGVPNSLARVMPPLGGLNAQSAALSGLNAATNTLAQTIGPLASVRIIGLGLSLIASGI